MENSLLYIVADAACLPDSMARATSESTIKAAIYFHFMTWCFRGKVEKQHATFFGTHYEKS